MKAFNNKPSTSKLVARFDQELKKILMEDLRSYRAKTQFLNLIRQQARTAA